MRLCESLLDWDKMNVRQIQSLLFTISSWDETFGKILVLLSTFSVIVLTMRLVYSRLLDTSAFRRAFAKAPTSSPVGE